MKISERHKAVELRHQKWTYSEISQFLKVSKGSLSRWLRDVSYTPRQAVNQKIAQVRMQNTATTNARLRSEKLERVSRILLQGKSEIQSLGLSELRMIGAMAYWAEGSKTLDSVVKFTNTDPELVLLMVRWLQEVCDVPREKLRFHLRLHPGEDAAGVELMWSTVTGIPRHQFYRTTLKQSESGGKAKRKIRWGIVSIIVCDTKLFYRIKGWINGLKESFVPANRLTALQPY